MTTIGQKPPVGGADDRSPVGTDAWLAETVGAATAAIDQVQVSDDLRVRLGYGHRAVEAIDVAPSEIRELPALTRMLLLGCASAANGGATWTGDQPWDQMPSRHLTRRYLDPGERVFAVMRLHWAQLIGPFAAACASILGVEVVSAAFGGTWSILGATSLAALLALGALVRMASAIPRCVIVTQRRVIVVEGAFRLTVRSLMPGRVQSLQFRQSRIGGLLGYGTLELEPAGTQYVAKRIRFVPAIVADDIVGAGPAHPRSLGVEWAAELIASTALGLAGLLISGIRPSLPVEWQAERRAAELEGVEPGVRVMFALGWVKAAVMIRAGHAARPLTAWLDQIARSEPRTRKAVAWTLAALTSYVYLNGGLLGVIHDAEGLAVIGAGMYKLARWRRRILKARDQIAGPPAQ